jgi:NADH-quinone oxidoreductase subunit G
MAVIEINGTEYSVDVGERLIDVLDTHGVFVPRFCYHKSLGVDGNCRMCMVEIEGQKRPQISCDTYVKDGMKVHTDTPKIKELRKNILEFELINHPIDCPICDQAGECKLQEYYMKEGLYDSELDAAKNHKNKAIDIGSNVMLDQERCVLCIRCVRFTRDITKTAELGVVKRSDGARIETFPGKKLDNAYAMNVVDLCPVGALTSKDFRFEKRVWFLQSVDTICHECSKGCNIVADFTPQTKYEPQKLYRYRPRENAKVNGYFMCDFGRLSYKEPSQLNDESTIGASSLRGYLQAHKDMVLFLISPECSLEQIDAVLALAKHYGARVSGYCDDYIDESFGDEYLRQNERASNKAGLIQYKIDISKEYMEQALQECSLVVSFDHKYAKEYAQKSEWIEITHRQKSASLCLNTTSALYQDGHFINCDGVLQLSKKVLKAPKEIPNIVMLIEQLVGQKIQFSIDKWKQTHGL